ncbi:MAG: adenylate/guanylate cyclase domain-containing protein [Candidatus Nanopelagicales bacterium]
MPGRACEDCGTANAADARFCEGCGTALQRHCDACGTAASADARFCRSCGAELNLSDRSPPALAIRKTVTVLFADLAGSTTFEEQVDAETAREVMVGYHNLLRTTADRHHAGVVKYIGDGFMAVWGVPEIGPDDADHAVGAAVELQRRFVDLAVQVSATHQASLALRVAVNTGEVVVGDGDADLVGDALNVAARLESQCPHGEVVVGEETWRATRGRHRYEPLGRVQLKGRAEAVPMYQWAGRPSEPAERVPFVGRVDEFARLQTALDGAVDSGTARLVSIIGDPGLGKTRLAAEFALSREIIALDIRCATDGSVALAPIVDMLRTRDLEVDLLIGTADRDRILRGLGNLDTGAATSVEETFWAVRRFLEVLASRQPLMITVDDLQWGDPLLLDFVEHLAEWVRDAPVLIVALARPEIRETRADFVVVGGWVADAIRLGGLDPAATAELAAHVVGADRLPGELLDRLPESTGGNPFFVRELVGMLVHDGVLVTGPDGWRLTIDADAIAVPPTIQALLASRLERLNSRDRRLLETASVIGTDFSPAAVSALGQFSPSAVSSALSRLRRLEWAEPSGAYLGDEPIWRFHHVLIRDVAYRRLLKSDRAALHEQFADWIQSGGNSGAVDPEQQIARHTDAAQGFLCDLGLRDARTAALALRAARGYLAAARRALDRDALTSAGNQAERGAALAVDDPDLRAELLQVACEALLSDGDVAAAGPLVDQLDALAGTAAPEDTLASQAACYRCQFLTYTDPSRLREVDERLSAVIESFRRTGAAAGLAKAYRVRAGARGRLGQIGDAELDLFEALIAARQGGDQRQVTAVLSQAPNAALWGPSPVPKAGGRCLDVVRMQRMTTGAPSLEATSLRCLAVLEVLRGRPEKARSMLADAHTILAELGLQHGLMETELYAGIVELMVGDPVAAEPHLRRALEGLDVLGVGVDAGQASALLARSLLAQGRVDEAALYATQSEQIAGHNLKTAIAWRAVRAEILCAQGRHGDATVLAIEAVAVAAGTDLVLDHAEACLSLSRVLAAAGDDSGAADARSQAESLYAAKDAVFAGVPAAATDQPVDTGRLRLRLANKASELFAAIRDAVQAHQSTAPFVVDTDTFVYEDRRGLAGSPIVCSDGILSAGHRKLQQYPHWETHTLAVRGQTLALESSQWCDDTGNETTTLELVEVNAEGSTLLYQGRFDEDDFDAAYAELERRYHAGEGRPFSVNGTAVSRWVEAMLARDVEAARCITRPDFQWLAAESALKPVARSVEEFFDWLRHRDDQLSDFSFCIPVMHWITPHCLVALSDIRGVGPDGETYEWPRIYVAEYRDGLAVSTREFEADQEDAAFAYAETKAGGATGVLTLSNTAARTFETALAALRAGDSAAFAGCCAEDVVQDDRRRIGGVPIIGRTQMHAGVQIFLNQYSSFEIDVLAVRGDRLVLASSRWADEAGNRTEQLHLAEVDSDGRVIYDGRFDAGDFLTAYCELEHRHYAGEGAQFSVSGRAAASWIAAVNRADIDAARTVCDPAFRWVAPPGGLKATERTLDDMFDWMAQRSRQVSGLTHWMQALRWMSPVCAIGLGAVSGIGLDGEDFQWRLHFVTQCRDGMLVSVHEFDSEAAAVEYARTVAEFNESRDARPSRLALDSRCCRLVRFLDAALTAGDFATVATCYAETIDYGDHRGISGNAIADRAEMAHALRRFRDHYDSLDSEVLAIRGQRLGLGRYRGFDDAGNESTGVVLREIDEAGLISFEIRYDERGFWDAFREMERRYYAGEGAEFAEHGRVSAAVAEAISRNDIDTVRRLTTADFRWYAPASALKPAERTIEDMVAWAAERSRLVTAQRSWIPVVQWLSPRCAVAAVQIFGRGPDGENYQWGLPFVSEFRDGLLASCREFETEDEAFAYAEEVVAREATPLTLTNKATAVYAVTLAASRAGDLDVAIAHAAPDVVIEDRRRLSGDLVIGHQQLRTALERLRDHYSAVETRTIAIRGERLHLQQLRFSDESGNQASQYHVIEVDDGGLTIYACRFDGDDFDGAYRELEARYLAGVGKPYAQNWTTAIRIMQAMDRLDVGAARALSTSDFTWSSPASTFTAPQRHLDEFFAWISERAKQVSTVSNYAAALYWVSPNVFAACGNATAVGTDGEQYTWARPCVGEFRNGLLASIRQFDDDADALAYATTLVEADQGPLSLSNAATRAMDAAAAAMRAQDVASAATNCAPDAVFEDRRRFFGDPIIGRDGLRPRLQQLRDQYTAADIQTVAVRGDCLALLWIRYSDDSGNLSELYQVVETDDDSQIRYGCRFDAEDFDAAYRELEDRYFAGEGRPFVAQGTATDRFFEALDRLDVESARQQCTPDFTWFSPASSLTAPERSLDEFFDWVTERARQVSSVRNYGAVIRWITPDVILTLGNVTAVKHDGAKYTWSRPYVGEFRNGLMVSMREFTDEATALAYATERAAMTDDRLAVRNRVSAASESLTRAMAEHNLDSAVAHFAEGWVADEHRRLGGDPIRGKGQVRVALTRILKQYSHFESTALAVRGDRVELVRSQWHDDAGNVSEHLHVYEVDDAGLLIGESRFDIDDFLGAYAEMERRYYAGEGAAFAALEPLAIRYFVEVNRGNLDVVFGELSAPDLHVVNRSRSGFPDRSGPEVQESLAELHNMLSATRWWYSAVHWVSPNLVLNRMEREGIGRDGERYAWTRILLNRIRDNRIDAIWEFDPDDLSSAFACADEQLRALG